MFSHYIKVLTNRNFFLLWLGQVISQFGDRLTQMALIGLVYELKPGSSLGLANMFSLAIIPVFLISPIAGVYIDRWNKQKTMYVSDFLRGVLILAIPFMPSRPLIYLFIFLSFCLGRFFLPAKMAIIPSLVEKKDFFMANSLISTTAMIAAVLGFGIGGMIVERWGVKSAFYLDAATFFCSALFVALMRIKERANFNPKDIIELGKEAINKVKRSFLVEVREGLRYIFSSEETRYAARMQFILFASIGSLYTVFIVFMQKTLSTVTSDLGWLAVGIGAGLFFGSLFYGKFATKITIKKAIYLSLLFSGLHLLAFTLFLKFHPYKMVALLSCVFLGVLCAPIVIALNTLIHKDSEDRFWGRIFSSLEVVIHLAFMLFMFIASFLAERMSPFTIIASVSIIIISFSSVGLIKNHDQNSRA
jgi:predicted MFS family arabinose efflux permease